MALPAMSAPKAAPAARTPRRAASCLVKLVMKGSPCSTWREADRRSHGLSADTTVQTRGPQEGETEIFPSGQKSGEKLSGRRENGDFGAHGLGKAGKKAIDDALRARADQRPAELHDPPRGATFGKKAQLRTIGLVSKADVGSAVRKAKEAATAAAFEPIAFGRADVGERQI